MNKPDLSKPTRQELRGLLVIFAFEAQKMVRAFWPILILIFVQKNNLPPGITAPLVLGFAAALLVLHTILFYLNFYFYIEGDQFVLKKGYLKKKVLSIPLERIQSVNTKQNLLQQILNVYTLEADSAGSVGHELRIYSLNGRYAKELTAYLQNFKITIVDDTAEPDSSAPVAEKTILQLSPLELLKIGISQNHIRTGLIIVAFGSQIFSQIKDIFQEEADQYSDSAANYLSNSGFLIITTLIILFLILSIAASLVLTVIKYYDFKLVKTNETYRITSGLLNKRNVLIPFSKVQQLNWETGPLKRIFGIYRISFKQAVSKQSRKVQLADAPGCLAKHLQDARNEIFEQDLPDESEKIYAHPRYFNLLWFQQGWLPAILPLPLYIEEPLWLIAGAAWLVFSAIYALLAVRKRYFQFNKTQILVHKGAIGDFWQQAQSFKTQTVDFRQSYFQKRRKLATLRINNASGHISIPYIREDMAKRLMNYLIFHVELSERKWM